MKRKRLAAIGSAALLAVLVALWWHHTSIRDRHIGEWTVVGIDMAAVEADLPEDDRIKLDKSRSQLRAYLLNKQIDFTWDEPHSFLVPVNLEGSVRGCIAGGWIRDEKNRACVNVCRWVSGSMYALWGRATYVDGELRIALVRYGKPEPVLRLQRR